MCVATRPRRLMQIAAALIASQQLASFAVPGKQRGASADKNANAENDNSANAFVFPPARRIVSWSRIAPSAEALHRCSRGQLEPTSSPPPPRRLRLLFTVLVFIADFVRHFHLISRSVTGFVLHIKTKWPGCSRVSNSSFSLDGFRLRHLSFSILAPRKADEAAFI